MSASPNNLRPESRAPTTGQILEQLAKMLTGVSFSEAPMLSRLLRYAVEQTLAGKADELKEYSVGVEVFDRGASFDPRTDTIVRVQARRLRARLDEYYKGPGLADPVRILLPKGHYAARFELAPAAEDSPRLHHVRSIDSRADRLIEGLQEFDRHAAGWLPVPHTSLIGRDGDVAEVARLLLSDSGRLLTLTGPGGSGKTRLAIQAASQIVRLFPGGVYFAELASIQDANSAAVVLAQILGMHRTGGKALAEALRDYLHRVTHAPTLLVIDNFEQVLSAGPLLVRLLEATPFLRILVTSRALLRVYGEREYPVSPLTTPDPATVPPLEQLAGIPAVRLFVERAQAADPAFTLSESNAAVVAELCSRLDGLPLAIELAASRTKILDPAAMLARMARPLDLLTRGAEGQAARHLTLRNTIDWSYDLLSEAEQKLFRRLSVLAGGCTLEAAEAVCNTLLDLGCDVAEGICSLSDKSLLKRVPPDGRGEVRFLMLETVREYARERLTASAEETAVRNAHAVYLLVIAEEGNADLSAAERERWLALCDREYANSRVALEWLIASCNRDWALRLAVALYWYWERREFLAEGRVRLLDIVKMHSCDPPTRLVAAAVSCAAALANSQGDYASAQREHLHALDLYIALGDRRAVAAQLSSLGTTAQFRGDLDAACDRFDQSVVAFQELGLQFEAAVTMSNLALVLNACGDRSRARSLLENAMSVFASCGKPVNVAWSLNRLADVARDSGDLPGAETLYRKALELFAAFQDVWGIGRSMTDLGYLAIARNYPEEARSSFKQAVEVFSGLGDNRGIARALEGLACLAAHQRQFTRALRIAGAAAGLRQKIGAPPRHSEQSALDATLQPAWQALDPAESRTAWETGLKTPVGPAVEYALTGN